MFAFNMVMRNSTIRYQCRRPMCTGMTLIQNSRVCVLDTKNSDSQNTFGPMTLWTCLKFPFAYPHGSDSLAVPAGCSEPAPDCITWTTNTLLTKMQCNLVQLLCSFSRGMLFQKKFTKPRILYSPDRRRLFVELMLTSLLVVVIFGDRTLIRDLGVQSVMEIAVLDIFRSWLFQKYN